MDIKIEPIKIEIDNPRRLCDIAYLMDRDDFLQEVVRLRKKWQIEKLITPKKELDWESFLVKNRQIDEFWQDIDSLRNRFKLTSNYNKALIFAIVCGVVNEDTYHTSFWASIDNDMDVGAPTMFVIYFTADTTEKELLKTFNEYKTQIKTLRKIKPLDRFFQSVGNTQPDTISNIKRDREWYWKKKQGKTCLEIAKEDKQKGSIDPEDYVETIKKAIRQYRKRLSFSKGGNLATP